VTDAIVIGAGVLGTSTAFRLAEAGLNVTVLEATRVGAGTSGTSFAWLNSNGKTPRAYHDLNAAGLQAHFALREMFPSTPWLHEGGSLEVAGYETIAALQAKIARLSEWGYAAEQISPAQLAEIEPEIDLGAVGDCAIGWFPNDGWIDPVLFSQAMIRAAQHRGATLHIGTKVDALSIAAGRVVGVVTTDGRRFDADVVVNCAGRFCNEAGPPSEFRIPLRPTAGFLVFTPPAPTLLSRVLRTPLVDLRPDGAGRLMLHDNDIDRELGLNSPISPTMPQAIRMVEQATRLLPGLAGLAPEAVRISARPIPGDGYSAVGPLPGITGYYLAVTHSAVTLSALFGKLVAQEITGTPAAELELFRPARFFSGNLAPIGDSEAFHQAH
jgi:glycine/D-amino acid oxidase-like deaminating enzyme